mmetsp:Transcript_2835/g.7075  ORF Transcript_2835/g.7075 Transcript_2835/m.7075 type:complete len:481 (-) Transcript_2835:46-1488(-)
MTAAQDAKAAGETKVLLRAVGRAILESIVGVLTLPIRVCRARSAYDNEIHSEDTEFNRTIINSCPALKSFKPAPWAPRGHSQTIWGAFVTTQDNYVYEREMVIMVDRVKVALDWCHPKGSAPVSEDAPIVLCLHGIACSSEGKSLKLMMEACIHRNWRGVVYNRRGHAGTSLLPDEFSEDDDVCKPFPMHADIDDMEAVIAYISAKFPRARIVCVGFSLGSNLLVRYLGHTKNQCKLLAGVSVANGFDLVAGTKRLAEEGEWDAIITMKMKRMLVHHSPDLMKAKKIEETHITQIVKSRSFREFDKIVMGQLYGYKDVDEYYRENSCLHLLQDIAVPLLCLGDHDDPLLSQDLLRASLDAGKLNRHIITALTRNGGHLGWIEGWKGKPWMSGAVSEYIHAVLENSERPQGAAAGPPLKVVDPLPVVVSLELTESDPPKVVLNLKASPGMAESTERTAPCLQPDISALKDAATLEAQINQM